MQNRDRPKFSFRGPSCAMQKHTNLETIKAILPPTRNPRPGFVNFFFVPNFHNFYPIPVDFDGVSTYIFGKGLRMTEVSLDILPLSEISLRISMKS
jgi:hypothetical protein